MKTPIWVNTYLGKWSVHLSLRATLQPPQDIRELGGRHPEDGWWGGSPRTPMHLSRVGISLPGSQGIGQYDWVP